MKKKLAIAFLTIVAVLTAALGCANNHAVTLDLSAVGAENVTLTVADGEAAVLPAGLPQKAGYDLVFYNGEQKFDFKQAITADLTLTGKWEAIGYAITYELNGGVNATANPSAYTADESVTLAEPRREYYTFLGWYRGEEKVTAIAKGSTGDVTLTAKWQATEYTVTYHLNGGVNAPANLETYTVNDAPELEEASRRYYTFAGWYTDENFDEESKITSFGNGVGGDLDLYAKWTANSFTISYHGLENGTHDNPSAYTVESGSIALADAARGGYTFTGWYTDAQLRNRVEAPIDAAQEHRNLEFWAGWTVDTYSVEFYAFGKRLTGTDFLNQTYTVETGMASFAVPQEKGYDFVAWYAQDGTDSGDWGEEVTSVAAGDYGNKVFYAKMVLKEITIVYHLDGGDNNAKNPQTYKLTDGNVTLYAPAKEHYVFERWYRTMQSTKETVAELNADAIIHNEINLYAQWSIRSYTVNYNSDGGSFDEAHAVKNFTYLDAAFDLPAATMDGYRFEGWFREEGGQPTGKKIERIDPATEAVDYELIAKWTAVDYEITYVLNKGPYDAADPVNPNDKTTVTVRETYALKDASRVGATFAGWYTSADFAEQSKVTELKNVSAPVTLYAKWTLETFTVRYELDGGTGDDRNPTTRTVETAPFLLWTATKSGFRFDGWYTSADFAPDSRVTELTAGAADAVLYAKWTAVDHNVEYVLFGGRNHADNPTGFNESDPVVLKEPTRSAYAFLGWFTKNGKENNDDWGEQVTELSGTADLTLYARWQAEIYTINYELNGGPNDEGNPASYTMEDEFVFVNPVWKGATFNGWFTTPDFQANSKITGVTAGSSGNLVLYAKWTLTTYKVTYNLNGGANASGNPATYTVADENIVLKAPTRDFYNFAGWFTNSALTTPLADNTLVTADAKAVTVYAKWTPDEFTVTYVLDGGVNDENNPATYTVETEFKLLPATKEGLGFFGWFTDPSFTDETLVEDFSKVHGNLMLYAKFAGSGKIVIKDGNDSFMVDVEEGKSFAPFVRNHLVYDHLLNADGTLYTGAMPAVGESITLYADPYTEGLTFTKKNNSYAVRAKLTDQAATVLRIPHIYAGLPVTEISAGSSGDLKYVVEAVIPNTVETIGNTVFKGAVALTSIVFEPGSALTSLGADMFFNAKFAGIDLSGTKLTAIADNTFENCTALNSVLLPNTVTALGNGAFKNCGALTSLDLSKTGVTSVGDTCFSGCAKLQRISLPATLKKIGATETNNSATMGAFYGCSNLQTVALAAGTKLELVGYSAFFGCSKLGSLSITMAENGVIGTAAFLRAFDNTATLTLDMTGAKPVSHYGMFINMGCQRVEIKGLVLPAGYDKSMTKSTLYTSTGTTAADKTFNTYGMFSGCNNVTEYVFDAALTYVPNFAFVGTKAGFSFAADVVTLGKGVFTNATFTTFDAAELRVISDQTFDNCAQLETVTNYNRVTTLGEYVFRNCAKLYSFDLGSNLTNVAPTAFMGATALRLTASGSNFTIIKKGEQNEYLIDAEGNLLFDWLIGTETTADDENGAAFTEGEATVYRVVKRRLPDAVVNFGMYYRNNESLREIVIGKKVQSIADYAFNGCRNLTKVSFAADSALTSVGDSAFRSSALTTIVLPASLETIGEYAFAGVNLTALAIPAAVTSLGSGAFDGCSTLATLTFGSGSALTEIGNYAFRGCNLAQVELPANLRTLGSQAFYQNRELTSVKFLGSAVTAIGESAFAQDASLVDVNFSALTALATLGASAFDGAAKLTGEATGTGENIVRAVLLPAGALTASGIGKNAFRGCAAMTEFTFTGTTKLTTIPEGMFADCVSLTDFDAPESVTTVGKNAFNGAAKLENLRLGSKVATISDGAFASTALTSFILPAGVKAVSASVFADCTKLAEFTFNAACTSIGSYAFENTALTKVEIGAAVTTISSNAFKNCLKLEEVTFAGNKLTTLNGNVFNGSTLKKVVFPANLPSGMKMTKEAFANCAYLEEMTLPFLGMQVTDVPVSQLSDATDPSSPFKSTSSSRYFGYIFSANAPTQPDLYEKYDARLNAASPSSVTTYYLPKSLRKVTVLGGKIYYKAFAGASMIETVVLPEDITFIGANAFEDCTSLKMSALSAKITKLGDEAFRNCTISSLTVGNEQEGSALAKFGRNVFAGCAVLTDLTVYAPGMVSVVSPASYSPFAGLAQKVTLSVRPETVDRYRDSFAWQNLANVTVKAIPAA